MDKQLHLLVCITSHGYGHVAQTAPVLDALYARMPDLRITVRTLVPMEHLRARIHVPFGYVRESGSDIGMLMSSALDIRVRESFDAYQEFHRDWGGRVMREARELQDLAPDFVLSNVGYLPLAGAFRAGIPCAGMSSLNWADILEHYCGAISGAHRITNQIRVAYNSALAFLRLTPAMAMPGLYRALSVGPIATIGRQRRDEIMSRLKLEGGEKLVLASLGGVSGQLPLDHWPRLPGVRWLVPGQWRTSHPDVHWIETLEMPFEDILASSDVLICKPGYGSFVEAACSGVRVVYASRDDWPETEPLAQWLQQHGECRQVGRAALESGDFSDLLLELLALPKPQPAVPSGIEEAAAWLEHQLRSASRRSSSIASP